MTQNNFDTNAPKLDYISLTSASDNWYTLVDNTLERDFHIYGERDRITSFEQYKGFRHKGGAYLGRGVQMGLPHYVLNIPGEHANAWLYTRSGVVFNGVDRLHVARCTRLDIQVTFAIVDGWDAREVSKIWQDNGVRARLVEGGDGMDTIYIGKRTTGHMWRAYVKEDMFGNRYLRFELELRKRDNHSIQAWADVVDGVTLSSVMNAYLPPRESLRTGDAEYDKLINKWLAACWGDYEKPKRVRAGKFIQWLTKQVTPAIENRMNDETIRPDLREWLEAIVSLLGGSIQWGDEGD